MSEENKSDMELSKALAELVAEYLPLQKGKAEDCKSEDKKEEDEKKSKGKAEDKDEDKMEKEYKSLTANDIPTIVEAVLKSLAATEAKKEDLAKSQATPAIDSDEKFKKSVVQALADLSEKFEDMSKRPARIRKSVVNGYDVVEKSEAKKEDAFTLAEINDVMCEMVQKGQLDSAVVGEFNVTESISDPLIKSRVAAAVKAKRGLR